MCVLKLGAEIPRALLSSKEILGAEGRFGAIES